MKQLVALLALLLAAPVRAELPFEFHGSAGVEAQARKTYDRNGDIFGLNFKCLEDDPVDPDNLPSDRLYCYCNSTQGGAMLCSFHGSPFLQFFGPQTQNLTVPSDGTGAAATAQLADLEGVQVFYRVTCNDPNGCEVTMPDDPVAGTILIIRSVPTQGPLVIHPVNAFLNMEGVWYGGGTHSTLTLYFDTDWFEVSRSQNIGTADGLRTVTVNSDGTGAQATFTLPTNFKNIAVDCNDPDGCIVAEMDETLHQSGDRVVVFAATFDVEFPDILGELAVSGASITLQAPQQVEFFYTVQWQQLTPVLP